MNDSAGQSERSSGDEKEADLEASLMADSALEHRLYSDIDAWRVELVRAARALDMGLADVRELVEWASTGSWNDFQERFREALLRKPEEVDRRIAPTLMKTHWCHHS